MTTAFRRFIENEFWCHPNNQRFEQEDSVLILLDEKQVGSLHHALSAEVIEYIQDNFKIESITSHPDGVKIKVRYPQGKTDGKFHIRINMEPVEWDKPTISYEEVVKLSKSKRKALHTVMWSVKGGGSGTIIPGNEIKVKDGMIITAVVTDNA